MIAIFLVLIYIFLVFKKRKRLAELKKRKEIERQMEAVAEQAELIESSESSASN